MYTYTLGQLLHDGGALTETLQNVLVADHLNTNTSGVSETVVYQRVITEV